MATVSPEKLLETPFTPSTTKTRILPVAPPWTRGDIGLNVLIDDAPTPRGTGYHHRDRGRGIRYTYCVGTPGDAPIGIRATEDEIARSGWTDVVGYRVGANRIEGAVP